MAAIHTGTLVHRWIYNISTTLGITHWNSYKIFASPFTNPSTYQFIYNPHTHIHTHWHELLKGSQSILPPLFPPCRGSMLCVCCLNEAILYMLPLSKVVFTRVQCTFSPPFLVFYFLCGRSQRGRRRREGLSCVGRTRQWLT